MEEIATPAKGQGVLFQTFQQDDRSLKIDWFLYFYNIGYTRSKLDLSRM